MAKLSSDQRDVYYRIEAIRAGIHKPILAALYKTQQAPPLEDGETGLGIAPANRIPPSQVNTLPEQIRYAANTLRSLTDHLTAEGWQGPDLWDHPLGRYSDRFLQRIAEGYSPPPSDLPAARLEPSDAETLVRTYGEDVAADYSIQPFPEQLTDLDKALLAFAAQAPTHYQRLTFQQQACLEAARIWRKLDSHGAVITAFKLSNAVGIVDEVALDKALLTFIQQVDRYFLGYPNQREALLRLAQLWGQRDSREATIRWLLMGNTQGVETDLTQLDPVLIAFVQGIPRGYQGKGHHRFALTEAYRLWQGLGSRTAAIQDLGIDPQVLLDNTDDPAQLAHNAAQIDRALLAFLETVPIAYDGNGEQREALIRLVQGWQQLEGRQPTLQWLFEKLRRMERANRDGVDAMPSPHPQILPRRPTRWQPDTLHLDAAIVDNGSFTWAEATRGGLFMPAHQVTVDAIIRMATLAQEARDRIGRPFLITHWYDPNRSGLSCESIDPNRHSLGDAIDFYCPGLTGRQLYWALDPWWPGGLGYDTHYPRLCHLDASSDRTRWIP
ncbi:MAG: peptidase M15A [Cyanobacteria bacterium]|nr:peptidase M15A [Cyanobacteriota bacterium]